MPGRLIKAAEGVGGIVGMSRSGSAKTTSKAITTAPSRVRLLMMSAIRVRGHGHWPRRGSARLFSSISTMVTGRMVFTRGSIRWKASKVRIRNSSIGGGSHTAQRGESRTAAQGIPAGHSQSAAETFFGIPSATSWYFGIMPERIVPTGWGNRPHRYRLTLPRVGHPGPPAFGGSRLITGIDHGSGTLHPSALTGITGARPGVTRW